MAQRVAIYGGSFNPPGAHHRAVVEALEPFFDRIIVVPSGPEPDQTPIYEVEPWHRAALADIAFRDLPKVEVDLFDLELANPTSNVGLHERYGHLGELWHVIGVELARGGSCEASYIHQQWEGGAALWRESNFCVVAGEGAEWAMEDLPPHHQLVRVVGPGTGSSTAIREKIFRRANYAADVQAQVGAYIERYGLYRGRIPARRTRWQAREPRLLIYADERNERAMRLAGAYRHWEDRVHPNAVLVLGGDGTMLGAIREHWRRRIPFIGVNQGHLGFLLNEPESLTPELLPEAECVIRLMPMLYVEAEAADGRIQRDLAFNDAWLERSSSQSAWLEVEVNGQVRIPKLVADGALVCTAAGSTAYARSMGVAPLLADTPGWILAGSNVMTPHGWKSALLSPETTVTLRSIGGEKRPLQAFVGGRSLGEAVVFRARPSRIATVELVFAAQRDMAEKVALIQFPPAGSSD